MSAHTQSDNKRIAKNTAMLYLRMFLSMAISLYTSRVILRTLGVEDFGVYNVVGGIVTLFTFLNASMSSATSRFLTFELGHNDREALSRTFTTAMAVHAAIALIIALIAEPFGLWFISHKMVVAPERLDAAYFVFHISVVSMVLGVLQVPYNASIIAHERMDFYAYVEIGNSVLRLSVVYLLQVLPWDKLELYSVMTMIVVVLVFLCYYLFCRLHYAETRLRRVWAPDIFKRMFAFSGWDLYGNLSVTMRTQGVNMLINMFFGPAVNAASGIATQVQGAVMAFVQNVTTAVRPQIIKRYAAGERDSMVSLIRNAVKLNFLILLLISVPLITELPFILHLWLGKVPAFAASFCAYTLLFNFFANLSFVIVTGVHATGKIFRPSIINGTLYLLVVPLSYVSFKFGGDANTSYLFNVLAVFIGMMSNAYTLNMLVPEFPFRRFVISDLVPCLLMMVASFALSVALVYLMPEGWMRLIANVLVSSIFIAAVGYRFILPQGVRVKLIQNLKDRIWKKAL